MILKLQGVDPRGMARLNQLVRASENQFAYMSFEYHSNDARVIVPKMVTESIVNIVSSKAQRMSMFKAGVFMEVVIEIKKQFVIYDFSDTDEDIGASVRQREFTWRVLLVPRAVVTAVLECLGVFPTDREDESFYWDNLDPGVIDEKALDMGRIKFFLEEAHKIVYEE